MGRTRDVSKILTSNTSILSLASASTTYATKTSTGLNLIIPSTIANTSGTASIGTNGTVSFSGATTVSLNDVFSSTYMNYKIIINAIGSAGNTVALRYRVSGSDNSTSNYSNQSADAGGSSFSAGRTTGGTNTPIIVLRSAESASADANVYNPFVTEETILQSNTFDPDSSGIWRVFNGLFGATTSFTGFSLISSNGTMAGTVSVYGFNK
jgi:hypothetical protein